MNRRHFVGGAAALAAMGRVTFGAPAADGSDDLKLGVASYSFRKFKREQAIEMTRKLNVQYINIKDFHLSMKDTAEEIAAGRKQFDDAGLIVLGGGNINLQKEDELRHAFDYAKAAGFPLIVCAPTKETMPAVEKLVKEYNIKAALHNHGPEDKHFPTPQSVLEVVKNMDPRIGCCIDIGHTVRAGIDVVQAIKLAGPRLLDMHVKDLTDFTDRNSQVAVGDGKIPIPAIFRELKRMKYQGGVMLEYEINDTDPLPGMIKSFAYMRGVLAGLHA